jgi:thymidylate synthase
MLIAEETLDDVLLKLYPELLGRPNSVAASRGPNAEIIGVTINIEKPRARLSRSETRGRLFSSLGEMLWYFTEDNRLDFIEPYIGRYKKESEDGASVYGGYGPRIFNQRGNNQFRNAIALLRERSQSRRAVIQIFNAEDIAATHTEIPCTETLQLLVRDGALHMVVCMRSNDAYIGLPHDVFCFTMIQEIVARTLGVELGKYHHFVGSMHLYDEDRQAASSLVEEGFQSRIEMPPMPAADPSASIQVVLKAESKIRGGDSIDGMLSGLDPYWCDLIRMLQIFFSRSDDHIEAIAREMSFSRYSPYIASRLAKARNG